MRIRRLWGVADVRRVAVVSVAQTDYVREDPTTGTAEMAFQVGRAAVSGTGLARGDIDLTVSASSDMLEGRSFNFVLGLEALGTYPAVNESHLEMDGAWAAYYAWLRLLAGDCDSALVVAWGKSSEGSLHHVLNTQLDPFCLAPLGLDHVATAALQADAYLARTAAPVEALDEVVARSRAAAARNPRLAAMGDGQPDVPVASPLWRRHCPPVTDGACAIVLAAEELAERVCPRPAWIRGADHRAETGALGHRDLSRAASAAWALGRARAQAGWEPGAQPDVAELGSSFAHQEPMLVEALGLASTVPTNPSGGPLAADPLMVTGLVRLAEAALQVMGAAGERQVEGARRALAHGATGHAMQQSIVWLLEGDGGR